MPGPAEIIAAQDQDLVLWAKDTSLPPEERSDAAKRLIEKYQRKLCGRFSKQVANRPKFLSATASPSVEAFCGDVLGKAIETWRPEGGATFSTWVYRLLSQAIVDASRLKHRAVVSPEDPDGVQRKDPKPDGSPLHELALQDALDLARRCLLALPERSQQVFVWTVLIRFDYEEIRAVWPEVTIANLKQIKHRAAAQFYESWDKNGGAAIENAAQMLAGAMADRVDAARIRDPKARQAYLAWIKTQTSDLGPAARTLGMTEDALRPLLNDAMQDLFKQVYRGKGPKKPTKDDLARAAALAETEGPKNALSGRILEVLDFARAAFGFAPPESAIHTLGTLLHSRLATPESHEAACRELGLKPAAFRKLLSDELDLEQDFLSRLAKFLEMPIDQVRALPRRPAGETRHRLRSRADFDPEAFQRRVLAWVLK